MQDELISKQAVMNCIDEYSQMIIRPLKLKDYIDKLPPVTPQQKTGHWIEHEIEDTLRWLECSNCHCETYNVKHNYCPNCGAMMKL